MASSTSANIGIVMTTGEVQVDGSRVPGNSAIFSGNLIGSGDRSASLQFSDGTSAVMRPGATMTVYRERSILQQGVAMQRGVDRHPVLLADGLKIAGTTPNAIALVGVRDETHFEVAAQEGESDVWTPSGMLVARIEPGNTLSFSIAQATGMQTNPKEVTLCGDLDADYQITSSNVIYKLQGTGLDSFVNKTIKVTGTTVGVPASPSEPQLLAVSKIQKQKSCEKGTVWWVGGIPLLIFIAAGGTLIGLGAAGDFGVHQPPVTPATP
jgi:hypothetical protein